MAGGITNAQISQLIDGTLPHFIEQGGFEVVFDRENFAVVDDWFKNERYGVDGGKRLEFRVVPDGNGNARFKKLFTPSEIQYRESAKYGNEEWCYADTRIDYEKHILKMAKGEKAILKYLKERWYAALLDLLKLIDSSAFNVPYDADDVETPKGVPWWVTTLTAGQEDYTGGFNGTTARYADGTTTTTTRGGLNSSSYWWWKNWVATKLGISLGTCRTLRRGMAKTDFKAPRNLKEYMNDKKPKRRIYSSVDERVEYGELVNSGSDNRNGDLNPFRTSGVLTLDGAEWIGVGAMANLTYKPIYVLDMASFMPVVHEDWWMAESENFTDVTQHNVVSKFLDFQYQFLCTNLRKQMVLHEVI